MGELATIQTFAAETVPQQDSERYDRHITDLISKLEKALDIKPVSTEIAAVRDHSLNTLGQIITAADKSASTKFFFDSDTLRWWHSRVSEHVYPTFGLMGTFFVTSERDSGGYERYYTVRRAYWNTPDPATRKLGIMTVGVFQQYMSRSGAHAAAKRMQLLHMIPCSS